MHLTCKLKENQGHFTRPHASFGIKEKVPGLQPSLFHLFSAQFLTAQTLPLSAHLKKLLMLQKRLTVTV